MIKFCAKPLETYVSLHKLSLLRLLGLTKKDVGPRVSVMFDFNVTPTPMEQKAFLTLQVRDSNAPTDAHFRIDNLTRWRVNVADHPTFSSFLQKMNRRHYARYCEAVKAFDDYGAKVYLVETDWSDHVDDVYRLYSKVADKHGVHLYDLEFFKSIASQPRYKLLGAWHQGAMIAHLVLLDTEPVLHGTVGGFDYHHSKACQAYSRLHYELVKLAIEAKKYQVVDIGLTANGAKSSLEFKSVPVCLDISARNRAVKGLLRLLSRFVSASIDSDGQLKVSRKSNR